MLQAGGDALIRMISQRERGELARFYTVTDPKKHEKGYTVYKVTARVSLYCSALTTSFLDNLATATTRNTLEGLRCFEKCQ